MSEIVALGASNTAGHGVGADLAYPAVLERLLRARGLEVVVRNQGISGNTTGQMLARLDAAITPATRVVLFQPGSNDERVGNPPEIREENIRIITAALTGRSIAAIRVAAAFAAARPGNLQNDGVHYTAAGHHRIAELLVDQVEAALRDRSSLQAHASINNGGTMAKIVQRQAQLATAHEFLSEANGLPEKVELVKGMIGPYSDAGKLTLLANWGADEIVRLTGPEVWRAALAAIDER